MCPARLHRGAGVHRCNRPAGHDGPHRADRWDRHGEYTWADPQPAVRQELATA